VQADSGSDSDSKKRRKECPLFNSASSYSGGRLRRLGADSRSQTVCWNNLLILVPTLGIGVGTWICLHYTRTLELQFWCFTFYRGSVKWRKNPGLGLLFVYYENTKGFMGINEKVNKEIKDKYWERKMKDIEKSRKQRKEEFNYEDLHSKWVKETIKIYKYRQNTTKFIILYHFWTTCFDSLESSSGHLVNWPKTI